MKNLLLKKSLFIPILLLLQILLSILVSVSVKCEMFTAQVELESLFSTQEEVIEAFEIFLAKEDARLKELRRRLVSYHERSRLDVHQVINNPLSAFLLVKALSFDLDDMMHISQQKIHTEELKSNIDTLKKHYRFPDKEDVNGAAVAITRLQDTYQLDIADMARGKLNDFCCSKSLSSDDCFELGRQNYNAGDYGHTILWMQEALIRSEEESKNSSNVQAYNSISKTDILEYLAFSSYQRGEIKDAIKVTEQLLKIEPNHPRAAGNIDHYERIITDRKGDDGLHSDTTFSIREKRDQSGYEKTKYEELCRGENQRVQLGLRCRYVHKNVPFLIIGPHKEEQVHFKPNIYIYHDVLYDSEIEIVKHLATPKFKRATVHDHATGELVVAKYRISKSAWLQGREDPTVDKVNTRIALLTGLEMSTAEELQVVNYGLGGHYEPHFDFARGDEKDAFKDLGTGNRIATFLFYMSDVEAGGATVFPSIDLTLWPKKGAAAFWYNLFEDGVGDILTRHAACPVLIGSKWVSNKWIHERGQEFKRPCNLKPSYNN